MQSSSEAVPIAQPYSGAQTISMSPQRGDGEGLSAEEVAADIAFSQSPD